ncbi:MAG TPA: hypothetical protein VLW26_00655 [Steroidobacteraceae bacterium]|nr:hypothetical protein [Steroidobacteraceae bacterium]
MDQLAQWDSFYVIVGSAAGGLIGLQFVVMTLIAEKPSRGILGAGAAYATPTIVHFSSCLLLGALLRAPWQSSAPIALLWGLVGLVGITYTVIVVRRMHRQTTYVAVLEDWIFHACLPLAAYLTLAVSALTGLRHLHEALFAVGAASLALLFTGIHNAWDAVFYHVVTRLDQSGD